MFKVLQDMLDYKLLSEVNQDHPCKVYEALHVPSETLVLVKKYQCELFPHVPAFMVKELAATKRLNHKAVLSIKAFCQRGTNCYIVYEYFPYNLADFSCFQIRQIKQILRVLLEVTKEMHSKQVLHREIKPQNILLDEKLNLKLKGFGRAKIEPRVNTPGVEELWYKAPEILLERNYSYEADVWSIGCIFGELLKGEPMFPGFSKLDQLKKICDFLGHKENLELNTQEDKFQSFFELDFEGLDLLKRLLAFEPSERITPDSALYHPFLSI